MLLIDQTVHFLFNTLHDIMQRSEHAAVVETVMRHERLHVHLMLAGAERVLFAPALTMLELEQFRLFTLQLLRKALLLDFHLFFVALDLVNVGAEEIHLVVHRLLLGLHDLELFLEDAHAVLHVAVLKAHQHEDHQQNDRDEHRRLLKCLLDRGKFLHHLVLVDVLAAESAGEAREHAVRLLLVGALVHLKLIAAVLKVCRRVLWLLLVIAAFAPVQVDQLGVVFKICHTVSVE